MPSDRVTEAAQELYAADPADFTQRRKALADMARAGGDQEAAKRITALRKPTRAASILNHLARADPSTPGRLETLAAGLRAAAQAKDGRRLRELSADRGELIDALTSQALAAAHVVGAPAGLREDIAATLTSVLADSDIAGQFASGTLTRAAQWAGFGLAPAMDTADAGAGADAGAELDAGAEPGTGARADAGAEPDAGAGARAGIDADSVADGESGPAASAARDGEQAAATHPARRPPPVREPPRTAAPPPKAPQPPRDAQSPDDVAGRRRRAFDEAERSLVTAVQAAAAAVAAEDHLEATVRDLEIRLTKARAELADARLRARRAEAAERKASQLIDRLPRP